MFSFVCLLTYLLTYFIGDKVLGHRRSLLPNTHRRRRRRRDASVELSCVGVGGVYWAGSRTLRPQDISAPRHFGTNFKPNHRWSCVLSELSWVQSVPTYRRSDAEVSGTTFLVQKCLETVLKCLMRVRSVLVPKCLVAEVSGNHWAHGGHARRWCQQTTS